MLVVQVLAPVHVWSLHAGMHACMHAAMNHDTVVQVGSEIMLKALQQAQCVPCCPRNHSMRADVAWIVSATSMPVATARAIRTRSSAAPETYPS